MKRSAFVSYAAAAVLALGAVPALAQENPPAGSPASQAGSRPSGGGTPTGTAAPRGGGSSGGGSSTSSGGGGGSSMGSTGSAAPRGGSSASMPGGGGDFGGFRPSAPERRSGDYAVPRGTSEGAFMGRGATSSRAPNSMANPGDAANDRRAVPAYSRPRDGRTPIGEAIDRRDAPRGGGTTVINYDPWFGYGYYGSSRYGYYNSYGPWFGGYGFGLGYFYDPWGYSYYSPYNYDYDYGYSSSRYSYSRGYRPVGNLRLKVAPRDGQVYVDGYYAGEVDSFDGVFQRLALEAGPHKVEIRAEGFEPVTFEVMVTAGETVTYKGELKRR